MNTGERIKALRNELKMTQEELGEKVGLQKSAIAKYENGRVVNLKRSMIAKLADALNCAPSYLMCMDDPEEKQPEQEAVDEKSARMQELLQQMSDDDKQDVLKYMEFLLSKK